MRDGWQRGGCRSGGASGVREPRRRLFPEAVMRSQGFGDINLGSEYTPDQIQFMNAMERYKRVRRRPFPTWHEVLEVLVSLGYRKATEAKDASE